MGTEGLTLDFDDLNIARQIQVHGYLHMLAVSILFYDHFITLGGEISHIWAKTKRNSSYLFFLNRYFAFLANLSVTILRFTPLSKESCFQYHRFRQILLVVSQILVCSLLTLRIYALYQKSKVILGVMLCGGAVLAGIACFSMFGQKSAQAPVRPDEGCNVGLSKPTALRLVWAWEALVAYDSLIVGLTLWRTLKERTERRLMTINVTLVDILLRDGAMYYAIMALCNLANIMIFYFTGPFLRGGLSTFSSSMSTTMLSRLMLNLHRVADEGLYTTKATNIYFQYAKDLDTLEPVELDTICSANPRQGLEPDSPCKWERESHP